MSHIKILFIIIAISFEFILYLYLSHAKENDLKESMQSYQTYHITQPLQATTNFYRTKARSVFSYFINKDEILELVSNANHSDDEHIRNKNREALHALLKDTYTDLKKFGIKQLHFHLEDTTSFLRLHKPSKYGDKLNDVRYSVVLANEEQRFVEGFEEGRIYNGYRFVFPLSYRHKHIGSVEVSIGFQAIANVLHTDFNLQPYMILKKSVVKDKVFTQERRNYTESYISSDFYHETNSYQSTAQTPIQDSITHEEFIEILSKQHNSLEERLKHDNSFQHFEHHDNFSYIMNFVPIRNIKQEHIGFIVLMDKDHEFLRIQNEYFYFMVLISLLGLSILLFIYHLEYANHKLIKSEKEALEATRSKSEFLANMSHEIRTPLNAIIGYLNLLRKMEHSAQIRSYLDVVMSSSQTLLSVINDILDFSKIESGKFSFEMNTFKTEDLFVELHQMFLPTASEKNITLTLEFEGMVHPYIKSDSTRLKQVVSNLLSNAIKFTPKHGTVKLNVNCNQNCLKVDIIDDGIGIEKEKQKNIFLKFEQADNSTTRKYGGTGLGLAISYFIIEQLNGKLTVESELNEGSTFSFSIPVGSSVHCEKETMESSTIKITTFSKQKILLVEDNKTNQMMMEIVLSELNLDTDIANDGLEAVELFRTNEYDLILMDENMPNMNGIEATKQIIRLQQTLEYKATPIIALTAEAVNNAREKFLQAGMKDYLSKPLDQEKLLLILNKYLI